MNRSMNRRSFCAAAASTLGAVYVPRLRAQPNEHSTFDMVAAVDRKRILLAAKQYVSFPIQTITAFTSPKSPGGPHDFFSQADYFWPNPKNPDGPYVNRDGQSNPENFNEHRKAMIRLSIEMPALTSAWLLLRRERSQSAAAKSYGRKAAEFLLAWFVAAETRMNPNLEYAQGVHGVSTGRNYGIIDTLHLVEVARAASLLTTEVLSDAEREGVKQWFREYLRWLKTSEKGIKERDTLNNHAVCWGLQAAEFARLIGDQDTRVEVRNQYETIFLPNQLSTEGSFPKELARTKPYSYSIFNFDVMATLCQSLSDGSSDEFSFKTSDGRGICKAAAFLYPYLENKSRWPYAHDVEHFDALPVRSPGLLFCGVHCDQPAYIKLWKTLNPDPTDPEIIRNYPIRQPLLWSA